METKSIPASVYARLESPPDYTVEDGIECEQCGETVHEDDAANCESCDYEFCDECINTTSGVRWCDTCGEPTFEE